MTDRPVVDVAAVRATLKAFVRPGQVFDIACFSARLVGWSKETMLQGYFDDIEEAMKALHRVRLGDGGRIQLNAHDLEPYLLDRVRNQFKAVSKAGGSTKTEDVRRRRWIMVDLDPRRPDGVPSSDVELKAALLTAHDVRRHLEDHGFPAPYIACSGNGIHMLYACDLPSEYEVREAIREMLGEIHERFDSDAVEIDTGVYQDTTRLKLYGTLSQKGEHSEARPHRRSEIIASPGEVVCVGLDTIRAYIAPRLALRAARQSSLGYTPVEGAEGDAFDFERDVIGHPDVASNILSHKGSGGGDIDATWVLRKCPACQHKRTGIASISRLASGALSASCKRSSCVFDWHWVRDTYAPRSHSLASNHPALKDVGTGERREGDPGTVGPAGVKTADVPEASSTEGLDRQTARRKATRWNEPPTQLQVADRVLREIDAEGCGVVYAEGSLWRYHGGSGCWRQVSDDAFKRCILKWDRERCGKERFEASVHMCSAALKTASVLTGRPDFFDQERRGFALNDAFVHADTDMGEVVLRDPGHIHRARAAIDCRFDPEAKGKLLERYLDTVHGPREVAPDATDEAKRRANDARAKVDLMGEVIFSALCGLGPHFNKAFLAYGPQGTGKSQWLAILSHLIPKDVQAHIQPHSIGHEYYAAELAGARLNVVTECDEGSVMREAGFKAVVSGEPITARKIRGAPFMFRPQALHLFAGNALPPAPGATDALWVRWLPISFTNRFRGTGEQIKDIGRKIAERETEAVIAWAVECGVRLLKRGHYTVPPSTKAIFEEWRVASDNVAVWIDSDDGPEVGNDNPKPEWPKASACYRRYKEWCSDNGFRPVNSRTFARRLESIEPAPGAPVIEILKKCRGYKRINLTLPDTIL